jgi:quercetin dioxygenase-like cupin family protein
MSNLIDPHPAAIPIDPFQTPVQYGRVDLDGLVGRRDVVQLSAQQAPPFAGVCALAPDDTLQLADRARQDIYVLSGTLIEGGRTHSTGSFLGRGHAVTLRAGPSGAIVFMYRDHVARTSGHETLNPNELVWHDGAVAGMTVAPLSKTHHRLALVRWRPGTHAQAHRHPHGEEIFVLRGELRDERGAYPSGSWLRFPPGSGHAPYAEQNTLILLRNGHLSTRPAITPASPQPL